MTKLWDTLMGILSSRLSPVPEAPEHISRELLQIARSEMAIALQEALSKPLAEEEEEEEQAALTTAYKAREFILEQELPKLDLAVLEALLEASAYPEFNVAEVVLGEPVKRVSDLHQSDIYELALFFGLLRETSMARASYLPVTNQLAFMTGTRFFDLRKEPDDYLRALLKLVTELPMELILNRMIPVGIQAMIKDNPESVQGIIDFMIQRELAIDQVDPQLCEEALATPSVVLREGAL